MFKQSVNIVEFTKLYNILNEIKNLFAFNITNYKTSNDFIYKIESNKIEFVNSIIIVQKKNHILLSDKKINKNDILILNQFPFKIEKLLDKINTQLIKQKYIFQSKLNIKNYILNLNSRIIYNKKKELKLTEKEINIIIFLNDHKNPQSINNLQNKVWGYSFNLETHTVETHIYKLRKKILDKFGDANFIISYDDGYII